MEPSEKKKEETAIPKKKKWTIRTVKTIGVRKKVGKGMGRLGGKQSIKKPKKGEGM